MRLPFVSRDLYDALQRRYDALLAAHLAHLRPAQPVAPAVPAPPLQKVQKVERDALQALAIERAGRDAGLRRHLLAYVATERKNTVPDETIADHLTHWADPDEDENES